MNNHDQSLLAIVADALVRSPSFYRRFLTESPLSAEGDETQRILNIWEDLFGEVIWEALHAAQQTSMVNTLIIALTEHEDAAHHLAGKILEHAQERACASRNPSPNPLAPKRDFRALLEAEGPYSPMARAVFEAALSHDIHQVHLSGPPGAGIASLARLLGLETLEAVSRPGAANILGLPKGQTLTFVFLDPFEHEATAQCQAFCRQMERNLGILGRTPDFQIRFMATTPDDQKVLGTTSPFVLFTNTDFEESPLYQACYSALSRRMVAKFGHGSRARVVTTAQLSRNLPLGSALRITKSDTVRCRKLTASLESA